MSEEKEVVTEKTARRLTQLLSKMPTERALKSFELAKKPVVHFQRSQILAGLTGTIGIVLFAFGIENLISNTLELSSPYIEICLGLLLLLISGLFLKKLF